MKENKVLNSLPVKNFLIIYGPGKREAILTMSLFTVVMIGFFVLGIFYEQILVKPIAFKWVFLIISFIFAIGIFNKNNWKAWPYFHVDENGIYFPSEIPSKKTTKYLFIPFENFIKIDYEKILGNRMGLTIKAYVSQQEKEIFFREDAFRNAFFGIESKEDKTISFAYAKGFHHTEQTAIELKEMLKNKSQTRSF